MYCELSRPAFGGRSNFGASVAQGPCVDGRQRSPASGVMVEKRGRPRPCDGHFGFSAGPITHPSQCRQYNLTDVSGPIRSGAVCWILSPAGNDYRRSQVAGRDLGLSAARHVPGQVPSHVAEKGRGAIGDSCIRWQVSDIGRDESSGCCFA